MDYDVLVIGGGPAGYVAAIRCAQLGLKTACVEKWIDKNGAPSLGGTCLNVGCIPSKAWLESSEFYEEATQHASDFGVTITDAKADVPSMLQRKDKIVSELTAGIAGLFKANKIDWVQGKAKLEKDKQVSVALHEGKTVSYQAKHIILATGSEPIHLSSMPLVDDIVVDSEGALNWQSVPEKLCVIGAGVIGLELGSVWRRLGAEVTVLQKDTFFDGMDKKVARTALQSFKKQGLEIKVNSDVEKIEVADGKAQVYLAGESQPQIFDKVIVAVGRRPYTKGLFGADVGVALNDWGQIEVDDLCQTSVAGVYAVGDAVRGAMLAHKASEEGVAVAERIAGQKPHLNYNAIPMVIYTEPEIAWAGKTEQELKAENIDYNVGEFPFAANGRAKTANNITGFVKILADAKTDRILGAHMIGGKVSELIGQVVIAMELEASAEDLARMVFAHPSLSESIHEAALAVDKRAIHAMNRK